MSCVGTLRLKLVYCPHYHCYLDSTLLAIQSPKFSRIFRGQIWDCNALLRLKHVNKKFINVSSITCLLNPCSSRLITSWLLAGSRNYKFLLKRRGQPQFFFKKGSPGKKSLGLNNYMVNNLFFGMFSNDWTTDKIQTVLDDPFQYLASIYKNSQCSPL